MNKDLASEQVQAFLMEAADKGIKAEKIALSKSPFKSVSSFELAEQVKSRTKALAKIGEFLNISGFIFPPSLAMEQSSSAATAAYKAKILGEGNLCYDITGGFGVDSYFFSKSFKQLVYCETQENLCALAKHNFQLLGAKNIKIMQGDGISLLQYCDAVYSDPSRRKNGMKVFSLEDLTPDLSVHYNTIINKTRKFLIKLSPMLDISKALTTLKDCTQIHVVSVAGEVKELLFLCEKDTLHLPEIFAIDISENDTKVFSSAINTEQVSYAYKTEKYIYDPSASLRKAMLADNYAASLSLKKLGLKTSLYTSDVYISDFQGRCFEFKEEFKVKAKLLEGKVKKANIITKAFPLKPDELRKKLKLADGGDDYIFAINDIENNYKLLLAHRV